MKILWVIKQKLETRPSALELFRSTCFGAWLDINEVNGDPLLIHTIIGCQVSSSVEKEELLYEVDKTMLCFNKHVFVLLPVFFSETKFRYHLPPNSPTTLIPRIFGDFCHWREKKLSDLDKLFKNNFHNLSDEDAVRVGLILVLDLVFLGRQKDYVLEHWSLQLVENLDAWNQYPWGSLIWRKTFKQLHDALLSRKIANKDCKKYSLSGFIYAFKVCCHWLFGSF